MVEGALAVPRLRWSRPDVDKKLIRVSSRHFTPAHHRSAATTKLQRPRPFHRAPRGPPPPLPRGRMQTCSPSRHSFCARASPSARSHVNRVLPDFRHVKREAGSEKESAGVVPAVRSAVTPASPIKTVRKPRKRKKKKKDSGTPANADPYPPHPCGCGSRLFKGALACRRSTAALT